MPWKLMQFPLYLHQGLLVIHMTTRNSKSSCSVDSPSHSCPTSIYIFADRSDMKSVKVVSSSILFVSWRRRTLTRLLPDLRPLKSSNFLRFFTIFSRISHWILQKPPPQHGKNTIVRTRSKTSSLRCCNTINRFRVRSCVFPLVFPSIDFPTFPCQQQSTPDKLSATHQPAIHITRKRLKLVTERSSFRLLCCVFCGEGGLGE
jgi:hypothetical protein